MQMGHEAIEFFPDEPIIDWQTGLSINTPMSLMGYPGWMGAQPELVSRIRMLRAKQNIVVDDFPNMEEIKEQEQ